MHEHHKIKRSTGGKDTRENIALLDSHCHTALHQIEMCLKSAKDQALVPDLLSSLYPNNPKARENCLLLATTAAFKTEDKAPDYSAFNDEDFVYITPPKIPKQTRDQVSMVAKQMKNPKTGKRLGVSGYLRLLIEMDLRKRGFKVKDPLLGS